MLKKVELFLLLLIIAGLIVLNRNLGKLAASDTVKVSGNTIVLDPGHGGSDPGKVGVNGVLEKELNLQIAMQVKEILEEKNIQVVMTRTTDEMLCPEDSDNRKREDMRKRVEMMNDVHPVLAVSIHQNSYTDPKVSGAQVFYYSESEEGKRMAELMQKALLEVDLNNKRAAKANDSYYLLKQTEVPTIIVECGFLSNPSEAEKLKTKEYQESVANAIVKGIETCIGN